MSHQLKNKPGRSEMGSVVLALKGVTIRPEGKWDVHIMGPIYLFFFLTENSLEPQSFFSGFSSEDAQGMLQQHLSILLVV